MLERRPDSLPVPSPPAGAAVRRAAVSPLTVALTVIGVGSSIAGGLTVAPIIGVGLCAWGLGVGATSLWHWARRRPKSEPIDPYAVPDPWRRFVREALSAQAKFAQAAGQCQPGPLRDRLDEVGGRIAEAVRECWRVARLGAALDAALANLDPEHTSAELRRVQDERRAGGGSASAEALDQTESALAARLQSGRRIQATGQRATDRLRVVTAQLNEAVASAAEVSLGTTDDDPTGALAANIDSVVDEIAALRQALEETGAAPAPGTASSP